MLKVTVGNAQHIGARVEQQDSFAFSALGDTRLSLHGGLLGIVADGMGGLEGGHLASSAAVDAFLAGYKRKTPSESIPAALYRSLEEANRAVLQVAQEIRVEGSSGTTLAAAVVHNDKLYWAAAGDSRIYLLRDGQLARVNEDHNYGASLLRLVAAGSMSREEAINDPRWSHLTSHLGMDALDIVDIAHHPLLMQGGDTVIVCTDGIYRSITDQEMIEAFGRSSPAKACESIKAMVLSKGRSQQDNLTIIAIQCQQEVSREHEESKNPRRRPVRGLRAAALVELVILFCLAAFYGVMRYGEELAHRQSVPAGQKQTPSHSTKQPRNNSDSPAKESTHAKPPASGSSSASSSPSSNAGPSQSSANQEAAPSAAKKSQSTGSEGPKKAPTTPAPQEDQQ